MWKVGTFYLGTFLSLFVKLFLKSFLWNLLSHVSGRLIVEDFSSESRGFLWLAEISSCGVVFLNSFGRRSSLGTLWFLKSPSYSCELHRDCGLCLSLG